MSSKELRDQIDLAAWELAEAEGHERRASKLRKDAINRLARLAIAVKEAEGQARRNLGAFNGSRITSL